MQSRSTEVLTGLTEIGISIGLLFGALHYFEFGHDLLAAILLAFAIRMAS